MYFAVSVQPYDFSVRRKTSDSMWNWKTSDSVVSENQILL